MVRYGLLLSLALFACKPGGDTSNGDSSSDTVESAFSLNPPSAGIGTQLRVRVTATRSAFEFADSFLDLGEGITVDAVTVEDGFNLIAYVTIADDAAPGARDATVTIADSDFHPLDVRLLAAPFLTRDDDVFAVLLGRDERFFLRVSLSVRQAVPIRFSLASMPRSVLSRACSSRKYASGVAATAA